MRSSPAFFSPGRISVVGVAVVFVAGVLAACRDRATERPSEATSSGDARSVDEPPGPPVVRDDATQLLFSFVDAHGRVQTVPRVDAVPEPVRQRVLVIDLDKTPEQRQAHRFAFFADLTTKAPDGTYAVVAVSRYDAARNAAGAAVAPPTDGSVVVYSATWCGFCKKAKAWLTQNHVPFVERDVEKTPGAQAELDGKLKSAGVAGGGIPVIDWAGTLVVGFDVASLQRLLREKPPSAPDGDDDGAAAPRAAPGPAAGHVADPGTTPPVE
jgi:glutaredoxin